VTVTIRAMATAAPPTTARRRRRARPRRTGSRRLAIGVALLVLAALLAARQLGLLFSDAIVWPVVLAASGAALIWRQWGGRGVQGPPPTSPLRAEPQAEAAGREERAVLRTLYRGGFGVALIVGAGLLFLYANGALSGLGDVALTALVAIVALGLILAPFWSRLARTLAAERSARIRSEERAEVAAHLHDSVLQTLALVQQRSDDPKTVATLARRQERELRDWLRGRPPVAAQAQDSFAAALQLAAEEVEEAHGLRIDVVAVGDRKLDEHTRAVVAAAREALTNAAKFAGDEAPVSVYAEASPAKVQVFVRDRGPGFDASAVPADRRGVRDSIVGRMARHGGRGTVTSAPGEGTEVELTLEGPAA
jgi:signal transduction histidine kinase